MKFEFHHTDDFELLIPRRLQKGGRFFRDFISLSFEDRDDLIFSLIEMVTLSDLHTIGETYLYSTDSKTKSKEIIEKYQKIVRKVVAKFNFSITEYSNWYTRGSYILLLNSDTEYEVPFRTPDWEQDPGTMEEERESSNFGTNSEQKLNENQIKEYLNYYAQLLFAELNLKEFPQTCIIVRPISVSDGQDDPIPLGNLFLHFATSTHRDLDFYLRLLNDFLIVWFKKKGYQVITEIQQKAKEKSEPKILRPYMPEFQNMEGRGKDKLITKLNPVGISLEDYYDRLFLNDSKKNEFENKIRLLIEVIVPKYYQLIQALTHDKSVDASLFSDLPKKLNENALFGIQGKSVLQKNINIDHFLKTLIRREVFKIGFLLFDICPAILKHILQGDGQFDSKSQSTESDYTYFWTEMFIPYTKDGNTDNIKSKVVSSLSQNEKDYLKRCKSYMVELSIPTPDLILT